MDFTRLEITDNGIVEQVFDAWCESDVELRVQLETELEWVKTTQPNNKKYVVQSKSDKNYPLIFEITTVRNEYCKTLKVKNAPYVVEKFFASMNFDYLSSLYKYLITSIIDLTEEQGLDKFRVYLDNDNIIAALVFSLFAQLLLPQEYAAKFSKDQRWLFIEKFT